MSMWEGHPILAEIRQGFKLRPTQTVDKSRPIIEAEGEDPVNIKYERKTPPPVIYTPQPKAQSKSICRVPQEALNIKHTPRAASPQVPKNLPAAPRPPSAPVKNQALLKLGGEITDRTALLNSIKGGIKLRKVTTVDKSGLILDDEQKALIATKSGTPGSSLSASQETLDSQGYSSLTPPSVHSGADDESFNSRFSDSESESNYQPPPPPKIQKPMKPFVPAANAPPPPPPPPTSSVAFVPKAAPPPPPPPPPSSRQTETQEKSLAFEAERPRRWQPKEEVVKEEPKKPDAAFEGFKVSKEAVEAEIPRGLAASRMAAFAKMVESGGSGAVFPKPLGPLIKNPPKRVTEAAANKTEDVKKIETTKRVDKVKPAEDKPKAKSSSDKQLVTKEEVKIHGPAKDKKSSEGKSSSSTIKSSTSKTSSSSSSKTADKSTTEVKKSSSSSKTSEIGAKKTSTTSKTSESADKPKISSSTSKSSSSTEKPKSSSSSSSSTKTLEIKEKKPLATVHSPATKYSVPITVKTDSDAPPVPKSQPPTVSPSSGRHFKDSASSDNNTRLGPYKYNGPQSSTPSPAASISPHSGSSYHTAVNSATSSYSSVPETREKPSPVSSVASSSAATSPRSTTSGADSAKENNAESSLFSRVNRPSATQHSRNFEKIRQSFGSKASNDANNNGGASSTLPPIDYSAGPVPAWKKNESSMTSHNNFTKTTSISIKAPWYNKSDYVNNDETTRQSGTRPDANCDPDTMNPEEMREAFKFTIDLKKEHPIQIIQR